MKNKLLFCLIFVSTFINAQTRYEVFGVDGKFGIVDFETGEIFVKPEYTNYKNFFIDFVDFETDSNLILNNRNKEETLIYTKGQNKSFYLRNRNSKFTENIMCLHIIENDKSVVVNNENLKIFLPKKYNELDAYNEWLFGIYEGKNIDIYNYKNFDNLKRTVNASKYIKNKVYKKNTKDYQKYYVFYNKQEVYVYDNAFELFKKYEIGGDNDKQVIDIIKFDFDVPLDISQDYFVDEWKVVYSNGYSEFDYEGVISFSAKGAFEVLSRGWSSILIEEKKSKKRFFFYIDLDNKKISLPKYYQNKLEIKFNK